MTRGNGRRAWTAEQKRQIATESLDPGTTPTVVARRHRISSGLLYTWRRQMRAGEFGPAVPAQPPGFARVDVAPEAPPRLLATFPVLPGPRPPLVPPLQAQAAPTVPDAGAAAGVIEVVLPGGALVRVDAHVDGPALRRVLDALERR